VRFFEGREEKTMGCRVLVTARVTLGVENCITIWAVDTSLGRFFGAEGDMGGSRLAWHGIHGTAWHGIGTGSCMYIHQDRLGFGGF